MKKLFTLGVAFCFLSMATFAQSQRLVLFEQFTQASCGPCAATNPSLNLLLNGNENKIVSLKHQTSWPGTDPMNTQNPSDVATRVTYYNVGGVPDAVIDGNAWHNHPAGVNQTLIDNRFNAPSNFEIEVLHSYNTAKDTMFITVEVTATAAISTPNTVLQLGVAERNIYFANPPGSNGEKHFEGVLRKMLPNANGTPVPASFAMNDVFSYTVAWPIASYIYNKNQLCAVAFIQNNTSKEVYQAGFSRTLMDLDAGMTNVSGMDYYNCNTSITPSVEITNFGTDAITSLNVNYKIDNGAVTSIPWTGTLGGWSGPFNTYNKTTFTLPSITVTPGMHSIEIYTSAPNGGTDLDANNDKYTATFFVSGNISSVPVVEGFVSTAFPPTDWARNNPDNGPTWTRAVNAGGFGTSTNSAKMDFYNSTDGNIDELYVPRVNLSNSVIPITLEFDVAHATYGTAYIDRLDVLASSDCGQTWNTVYTKSYPALSTVTNPVTAAFTPTAAQWRAESVNLDSYAGQPELLLVFRGISGYGNNLYIDNINVADLAASVYQNTFDQSFEIYPNPSNGVFNVRSTENFNDDLNIVISNVIGQEVIRLQNVSLNQAGLLIDLSKQLSGTYFVRIFNEENVTTQKITLTK
ncbi:MAG TPA: T9SS type A sorting domain-containing protein [Bacteroidia bacterium]|nr:T9SS type A sorting domain-containing protein [Bacteroidia bacterium]HNT79095.1 T9SS type A sorting domain-containing protein [Bacteroidia bacterium]